ncbi:MAG: hypothetical protein AAGJ40_21825 [Planctomycetota bacterium]
MLTVLSLGILWLIGEASDKPYLRRIAGPLFTAAMGILAYGAAALSTSFSDSIRYSGATKEFVSAILSAINRGDVDDAHAELRRFDAVSHETYEGGAFLKWLADPAARLAEEGTRDDNSADPNDVTTTPDR